MYTKAESQQLRGIAILIMIFLHLFNSEAKLALCNSGISLWGVPILTRIARFASICVPFYLFLSGYGLYIVWQKRGSVSPLQRILKLYLNLFVVAAIFVPLGIWIAPDKYPGTWLDFINSMTCWNPTYNYEWWFLFPYILLVLTSPWIFKVIARCNVLVNICLFFVGYCISIILLHYTWNYIITNRPAYMVIYYLYLLPAFFSGALFVKFDIVSKVKNIFSIKNRVINIFFTLSFIPFILLRSAVDGEKTNIFCVFFVVIWFALIRKNKIIECVLEKLGNQSCNMWLVHTFFCVYLFRDVIYSLQEPTLIFLFTVFVNYCSGVVINLLLRPIQQKVMSILKV